MPQRPLPFFEQREQDLLAQLILERALADEAREGKAARVMQFWVGRGVRVEYAVLMVVQPADEEGATCHRAITQMTERVIARTYHGQADTLHAPAREIKL